MRVGYYVPAVLLRHAGIRARVKATLAAWRRAGVEGVLLDAPARSGGPDLLRHLAADRAAARGVAGLDHLHVRLFFPTLAWRRVAQDLPTSVEVHAGLRRAEHARDLARVVLGGMTSRRLLQRCRAAVFVTRELASLPEYAAVATRVAIGNGIPERPPFPAPAHPRPRVGMAAGSTAAWQGLDLFATLAEQHRECDFVIIAERSIASAVRRIVAGMRVNVDITQDEADYLDALSRLDATVGTLALHRKGLREAAPLKVRDAVMAGIPTVLPYADTNLEDVRDPALISWRPGDDDNRLGEWLRGTAGQRTSAAAREAISIDTVEGRRLRAIGATVR